MTFLLCCLILAAAVPSAVAQSTQDTYNFVQAIVLLLTTVLTLLAAVYKFMQLMSSTQRSLLDFIKERLGGVK